MYTIYIGCILHTSYFFNNLSSITFDMHPISAGSPIPGRLRLAGTDPAHPRILGGRPTLSLRPAVGTLPENKIFQQENHVF